MNSIKVGILYEELNIQKKKFYKIKYITKSSYLCAIIYPILLLSKKINNIIIII